jgi:hypothetical protein
MWFDICLLAYESSDSELKWRDGLTALFKVQESGPRDGESGSQTCIVNPDPSVWRSQMTDGKDTHSHELALVVKVSIRARAELIYAIGFDQRITLLDQREYQRYSVKWQNSIFTCAIHGDDLQWRARSQ